MLAKCGKETLIALSQRKILLDWMATNARGLETRPGRRDLLATACRSARIPLALSGRRYESEQSLLPLSDALAAQHPWPPEIEFVPKYLVVLLDSAISQYPLALAITRQKMNRLEEMSRSLFVETLARLLRFYLDAQPTSTFFLARAIKQEVGYKSVGSYYWIVGIGTGDNPQVS